MENRTINMSNIIGMDVRDISNTDSQQYVKEIINLEKDKTGWRIRDPLKDVLTGLLYTDLITEVLPWGTDKVLIHKNDSLYLHHITSDAIDQSPIEYWTLGYSFYIWGTNYPMTYVVRDTTNHKTKILEFTDRIMFINNDAGNLDYSSEFLLNEFDANTGDCTWVGMCNHADNTENSKAWTYGLDKYCINYDKYSAKEKYKVALLQQINYTYNYSRYIAVSQVGSDSYLHLFNFQDKTPVRYDKRVKLTGTAMFGTDLQKQYMDVEGSKYLYSSTNISNGLSTSTQLNTYPIINFNDNLWIGTDDGVKMWDGNVWVDKSNGLSGDSLIVRSMVVFNNELWIGTYRVGPYKWNGSIWASNTTGYNSYMFYWHCMIVFNNELWITGILWSTTGTFRWNGSSWVTSNTGRTGTAIGASSLYIFEDSLWVSTDPGPYRLESGTWVDKTTGSPTDGGTQGRQGFCEYKGSLYYGTYSKGVYKWNGTTWIAFNTGYVNMVKDLFVFEDQLYLATLSSGLFVLVGSAWESASSGVGGLTSMIVNYKNNLYITTAATGVWKLTNSIATSKLYYNSITSIPTITLNDNSNTYTTGTGITSGVSDVRSIKCMQMIFDDDGDTTAKYVIAMDGQQLKVFLTEKVGTLTNIESASVSLTAALVSITSQYFYNFHGMHLVKNNYYELSNSNKRGFSLIIYYDNKFQIVDFWTWNDATSAKTLQYTVQTVGQPITNNLLDNNNQCWVWGVQNATISANGQAHNFYINQDQWIYKIPITGVSQTADDINNIQKIYNSEMSRYCDPEGIILGGIQTSSSGYIETEINLSKPLPARPSFFADTASNTAADAEVLSKIGDISNQIQNLKLKGLTKTNTYHGYLYYKLTNSSTTRTLNLYKDQNMNANTLVAHYSGVDGMLCAITADNTSGITGVVDIKYTADDTALTNVFYFYIDDGLLYETQANSLMMYGDTALQMSRLTLAGATNVNTDSGRLYWSLVNVTTTRTINIYNDRARTCLVAHYSGADGAACVIAADNTSGITGTVDITYTTDDTDQGNVIVLGIDNAEVFNIYDMPRANDLTGGGFRTPIEIDSGSAIYYNSDDYSTYHKYWIFALLYSGLYDSVIPYINVAKGSINPSNNSYQLTFWGQDAQYENQIYEDAVNKDLIRRFSNLNTNDLSNANINAVKKYVLDDKIFYKVGDVYRDKFIVNNAFWQQNKSVLFEIQDMTFSSGDLLQTINYNDKSFYWGVGLKYLNLLNRIQLNSKPTAIQEINSNMGIIACENDIYYVSGSDESAISVSLIKSNMGLESGNFKSLVTNGNQGFYYSRAGVFMIDNSSVIPIGEPVGEYLYRQESANMLGIDQKNGLLYIPLDDTKMVVLSTELKNGDYSQTTTITINYNNNFSLYDWNGNSHKIYSFVDDITANTYIDFVGNLKDHVIIRSGSKLLIPEYKETNGTECPLCRVWSKRMSFGSYNTLKQLDTLYSEFINELNINLARYGVDYYKIKIITDNDYTNAYTIKYGDLHSTYSDCTAHAITLTDTDIGIKSIAIPLPNMHFHEVQFIFEFGRLKDCKTPTDHTSSTSLINIGMDVNNMIYKKQDIN